MMSDASAHALQERPFQLDPNDALSASGAWYDGQPLTTQLLNAYTVLIPEGERFIIRSCSRYSPQAASELQKELKKLFFQEGQHSREHQRVLDAMRAEGLSLDILRWLIARFCYGLLEPLAPPKLRLATAAAIEHHNAVIATYFLNDALLRGIRSGGLRRLFLWHFAEEIEHQETAFKLLQSVSRSWPLRALGLVFSCGTFMLSLALGTLLLAFKTGSAHTVGVWSELLTYCCAGRGLVATMVKESVRYLRPGFMPSRRKSNPARLGTRRTRAPRGRAPQVSAISAGTPCAGGGPQQDGAGPGAGPQAAGREPVLRSVYQRIRRRLGNKRRDSVAQFLHVLVPRFPRPPAHRGGGKRRDRTLWHRHARRAAAGRKPAATRGARSQDRSAL
jgi:predicted metal-dependent hydrolase